MTPARGESAHSGETGARQVTFVAPDVCADPVRLAIVQDVVRRMSALHHDAIVPVVELAQDGARWGVVEAVPEGEPLDRIGALPPVDALHVARQLADGLAAAHASGVVHGGLTPAYVWIRRDDRRRAALAGFATAAVSAPPTAYTPPERLRGAPADVRGDVFALGLVLFEMLEGRPFLAGGEDEIRAALLDGTGPLLPRFSHIQPTGVSALVARAIRRAPAHRPQTMAQLRSEIETRLARLGEIRIEAKRARPRAEDVPVVRRRMMVVDDALEEPVEIPAVAPALSRRTRRARRWPLVGGAVFVALAIASARVARVGTAPVAVVPEPPPPVVVAPDPPPPEPPTAAEEPVVAEPTPEEAAPEVEAPVEPVVVVPEPVPNVAPRIVSSRPRAGRLDVAEGAAVDFEVSATDDAADPPRYTWLLDGRVVARTPRWRFVASAAAGGVVRAVEARVSDATGLAAAAVSWTVAVGPRMSEADVRGWLERVAAAWQRGDVATLRLYGISSGDPEGARRGDTVTIVNETIRTDGPYGTVAFDRAVRDARGRIVWTGRESFELEKKPSGLVARR